MQGIYYLASADTYGNDIWARFVGGGLPTAALGIIAVFAVLTLLWICLEVFKYFFYTLPENKKKEANEKADAPVEQPVQAQAPQVSYSDDKAIVAAIIAAITAAREEEGIPSTVPFRVVSFRKKK